MRARRTRRRASGVAGPVSSHDQAGDRRRPRAGRRTQYHASVEHSALRRARLCVAPRLAAARAISAPQPSSKCSRNQRPPCAAAPLRRGAEPVRSGGVAGRESPGRRLRGQRTSRRLGRASAIRRLRTTPRRRRRLAERGTRMRSPHARCDAGRRLVSALEQRAARAARDHAEPARGDRPRRPPRGTRRTVAAQRTASASERGSQLVGRVVGRVVEAVGPLDQHRARHADRWDPRARAWSLPPEYGTSAMRVSAEVARPEYDVHPVDWPRRGSRAAAPRRTSAAKHGGRSSRNVLPHAS